MVDSTLIVWEDLGSSPMYANYVLLFYYWFKDKYDDVICIVNLCWFMYITKCELA